MSPYIHTLLTSHPGQTSAPCWGSPCSPRKRWLHSGSPRTCPGTQSRACRPGAVAAAMAGWEPAPPNCCSVSRWLWRKWQNVKIIIRLLQNLFLLLYPPSCCFTHACARAHACTDTHTCARARTHTHVRTQTCKHSFWNKQAESSIGLWLDYILPYFMGENSISRVQGPALLTRPATGSEMLSFWEWRWRPGLLQWFHFFISTTILAPLLILMHRLQE